MLNKLKFIFLSGVFFLNGARAKAQGTDLSGVRGIDLTIDEIKNIITGLACWLIDIALVLMVIAVVFYGIKFLLSQGDSGKIIDARKGLIWAIVGVAVILGTYTIIASVGNFITEGKFEFNILDC